MIAFGADHLVLLKGQYVYTAGDNIFAQLLRSTADGVCNTHKYARAVGCSPYSTYLITDDGVYRSGPYRRIVNEPVLSFAATDYFHAYLTSEGNYRDSEGNYLPGPYNEVKVRGNLSAVLDTYGQVILLHPQRVVIPLMGVVHLDLTRTAVWLVTHEGHCYAYNDGQLQRYDLISRIRALACGNTHTLLLTDQGEVWSHGSDQWGQLGTGLLVDGSRDYFAPVVGIGRCKAVFAGEEMSAVLTTAGQRLVWGRNDNQQLGFRSTYEGVVQPHLLATIG